MAASSFSKKLGSWAWGTRGVVAAVPLLMTTGVDGVVSEVEGGERYVGRGALSSSDVDSGRESGLPALTLDSAEVKEELRDSDALEA